MKEIAPEPPSIIRNDTARIQGLFQQACDSLLRPF